MSKDISRTVMVGRLTANAEMKQVGEHDLAKFSIAVNGWQNGEERADFFPVVVWGKQAKALQPYLVKGKMVCVDGRMRQERWEKDGQKQSRSVLEADSVQLVGGKVDGQAAAPVADPVKPFPVEEAPF